MRLWTKVAIAFAFVPLVASAQYKDLDTAVSSLERGFGSGDAQAVVAGVADGDRVMLQFPGLIEERSDPYYGRDQATYALDSLFNKVHPSGFDRLGSRGNSAEKQYSITASWTIDVGGRAENRDLYVTLQKKNDRWVIASIRSASK
jgi:hypothetical protein